MLNPPFKLASLSNAAAADEPADAAPAGRARLQQLNPHFYCSVIGTCLGTTDLRKVIAKFVDVHGRTDIDLHHDAVSLANQGGPSAKALNKALDHTHEAVLRRFDKVKGSDALAAAWDESRERGEIPGAYWALLTHRDVTEALRAKVFGEVHMLSHLVGAANRADIRRLVGLEHENAELRERLDRQQLRSQEVLATRDEAMARLQDELANALRQLGEVRAQRADAPVAAMAESQAALVAIQAERRERAEQATAAAQAESARLQDELDQLQRHLATLQQELGAAETQLREFGEPDEEGGASSLSAHLQGRRVLYVGGRPSSTPAIRGLVERHGGSFQRHDGGLEDRKGLLSSAVAAADLVVFPVDCIDHDSAGNLKRICTRQSISFVPLRSASVASFAAAIANRHGDTGGSGHSPICPRHG